MDMYFAYVLSEDVRRHYKKQKKVLIKFSTQSVAIASTGFKFAA